MTGAPRVAAGARELDLAGCHALLRERGWGILSTADAATACPYAVPVAYAIDGDSIYVASGRGRKLRALELNPGLCLTVSDVARMDCWRSVVVIGRARWLTDASGRAAAIRAFVRQRGPDGRRLSPAAAARFVTARLFRIDVVELSGRIAGAPERGSIALEHDSRDATAGVADTTYAPEAGDARRHAGIAMDSVRRIVRDLSAAAELTLGAAGGRAPPVSPETVQEQRLVAGFLALSPEEQRLLSQTLASWVAVSGLHEAAPTMFLDG